MLYAGSDGSVTGKGRRGDGHCADTDRKFIRQQFGFIRKFIGRYVLSRELILKQFILKQFVLKQFIFEQFILGQFIFE